MLILVVYFYYFFLFFADPPEITVETPIVYSGEGQEAMLVCIVHGETQPEVKFISKAILKVYVLRIHIAYNAMARAWSFGILLIFFLCTILFCCCLVFYLGAQKMVISARSNRCNYECQNHHAITIALKWLWNILWVWVRAMDQRSWSRHMNCMEAENSSNNENLLRQFTSVGRRTKW